MSAYDSWFPEALAEPGGGALFLTRRDGVQLVVELVGEIDATNARVLVEQLREAIAAEGVRDLVVDLIGVEFCDVAGLRALLAVQKDALHRGAVCRFARPSPAITWLLHFGELEGVLAGIEPDNAGREQYSPGPG